MIPVDQMTRFDNLRQRTAKAIARSLKIDPAHKSYEGTWEVEVSFPNYFEDAFGCALPDFVEIRLHCYVLGPSRHYRWIGNNFLDALRKAEAEVDSWSEELKEDEE